MPRSNRPRRSGRRPTASGSAAGSAAGRAGEQGPGYSLRQRVEDWAGVDYVVRAVSGAAATKSYRCPGCDHEVTAGTPHVVAWPLEATTAAVVFDRSADGSPQRRHWHTPCWAARGRRRPR